MKSFNRMNTQPLQIQRSTRTHDIRVLTSFKPGVCAPVAYIPLLREDAMNARVRINCEMLETKELLLNRVMLRATAYVVPLLALERFQGSRDQFDRSYMGQPKDKDAGATVVPFVETQPFGAHGSNAVFRALGLHGKSTDQVNTAVVESYNKIINFRSNNRSANLPQRARLDATLAPAFWMHGRFESIVPDVDLAMMDGEIPLNVVEARMPIRNLGIGAEGAPNAVGGKDSGGAFSGNGWRLDPTANGSTAGRGIGIMLSDASGLPDVFAELQQDGITVSLSNLELAKKTQAFAKLRQRFDGFDDEYLIDMLMEGLTVPDQFLKQPILLADKRAPISQVKRYATDSANLAASATSGGVEMTLNLRVPRLAVGGVVMVILEAVPEQLFERQADPFFHCQNHDKWPEADRDFLDPEKVEVILNKQIDTDHASPNNTFGYAELNWPWNNWPTRVGGKFLRPTANTATDDARQRIYAVENVNPTLSADFYIVNAMHQKPFLDLVSDPFEVTLAGAARIEGNTVFGPPLVEANGNYEAVLEDVPTERIPQS